MTSTVNEPTPTPPANPYRSVRAGGEITWLSAVVLAGFLLVLGGEPARLWARYDRSGLEAGQIWRLVTGHFAHLGGPHWLLNMLALAMLRWLLGPGLGLWEWILIFAISMLTIDGGLYFLSPEVAWYVGLSGILHAVAVVTGVRLAARERWLGVSLLVGLALKVASEQYFGASEWSVAAAGGGVVVDAHLYGALGGVLCIGLLPGIRRPLEAIIPAPKP
jgi:rhomboid family GlyGly-CTERM serine protease